MHLYSFGFAIVDCPKSALANLVVIVEIVGGKYKLFQGVHIPWVSMPLRNTVASGTITGIHWIS